VSRIGCSRKSSTDIKESLVTEVDMKLGKKYKTKHEEDAKKFGLCVKFFGIGEDGPHHAPRVLASAKTRYRLA
jgi:hypothetical protein